uniref:Uncharacterized protein n=1 Tax=Salix viminalis TaxID=40686 RepID=A0A6N2N5B5_SALVM
MEEFSGSLSSSSLTTRFPESKSSATGFLADLEVLEDQMMLSLTRSPSLVIFNTPDELVRGVSLLATQTTVMMDTLLYHIPKYRFLELPGLKNPILKLPSAETMLSPSLIEKMDSYRSIFSSRSEGVASSSASRDPWRFMDPFYDLRQ